jgi:capsular exopolysaccharide synthesis family protein
MTDRWTLDLPTFLHAVRRRWWLILLLTVAATALAYGVSSLQDDRYDATADLLFRPVDPAPRIDPTTPPPDLADAPERTAATNLALASSESVARRAHEALDSGLSVEELRDRVSFEPKGQADIVSVKASAGSAEEAARIANAFANEVVEVRRENAQAKVQQVIDTIRGQLEVLDPASPTVATLTRRAEQLEAEKALQTGDVELAEEALPPAEPSAPKPLRNGVIGGFLGLLLGIGIALVLQRLDRRLDDEDAVASITGAPLIGRIPVRKDAEWERQLYLEAFQFLRANLQLRADTKDCRTIAVTSALPGNGKSTVVVGLADALGLSGADVVAVDCDLRRPTLHSNFALDSDSGLTSVIMGASSATDELQDTTHARVRLLAAGRSTPISPSVLAASDRLHELFDELRDSADYVLVDTAPVVIGAEASTVAAAVDGVIVVVDQDTVGPDLLEAATQQLHNAGAKIIGVVLNRAEVLLADEAYRGYYGSGAARTEDTGPTIRWSEAAPAPIVPKPLPATTGGDGAGPSSGGGTGGKPRANGGNRPQGSNRRRSQRQKAGARKGGSGPAGGKGGGGSGNGGGKGPGKAEDGPASES